MFGEWRVFLLLLWKNFVVRRRHWIVSSLLQIGIPLLIVGLIQLSRDNITKYSHGYPNTYPDGNDQNIKDEYYPVKTKYDLLREYEFSRPSYLFYAPKNGFTENLMNLTASCLSSPTHKTSGIYISFYNIIYFFFDLFL